MDNNFVGENSGVKVNNNNVNDINKEELVKAYVGNKYDQLKSGLSFGALLFSWGYLLYRKMYKLGYIILGVYILVIGMSFYFYTRSSLINLINILISVYLGIKFKELYISDVNRKVDEIISKNSNASYDELIDICKKNGGTSIVAIILYIVIGIFVYCWSFADIVLKMNKYQKGLLTISNETISQFELKSEDNYSSGKYEYGEIKYVYSDKYNNCSITVTLTDEFVLSDNSDVDLLAKKFLSKVYKYNIADIIISNYVNKNDISFNYYVDGNMYYYLYFDNKRGEIVAFDVGKNRGGTCSNYMNNIVDAMYLR